MKRNSAWMLLLLGGCMHLPERSAVETAPQRYQVKCSGECLQLKDKHKGTDQFLRKMDDLLREKQQAAAEGLALRRLDTAIAVLRERDVKHAPTEVEFVLARVVDAQLGHPRDDGWVARLHRKGRGLEQAEATLAQGREHLRKQQWKPACDLIQRNKDMLGAYPYQAVYAGLVLAEAQRRLDAMQAGAQAWQQTAVQAIRWAERWPAPDLWEQVAGQRPVPTPWPMEVATALLPRVPECLRDLPKNPAFAAEALVWFTIGNTRLQRSEGSAALSAFKRADSHGAFLEWDDFLSLHQAKALLALEQTPAATSLLTTLANRPATCCWRLPALALLGSGKLQEGHTEQARAFLREAVEASSENFLFRAEAEANMGLVCLVSGDEPNGMRWLHSAQQRFEAAGDRFGLRQCRENEAKYLEQIGRTEAATNVWNQMNERIHQ